MADKTLHFITGLPRSGSNLITTILKQNTNIHGQSVSSLNQLINNTVKDWNRIEQNQVYTNDVAKKGVLNGMIDGYYKNIEKPIVFDRDFGWSSHIGLMEAILDRPIKLIVCVRNPAEIITSFERLHNSNPLDSSKMDAMSRGTSSIASRAYNVAGPDGILGICHRNSKDAITMGYLDKMIFIEYNRFCSNPKSQTKRIYDFFEIPQYDHDFTNIVQDDIYTEIALNYKNALKLKPSLEKTTVNCVKYIGLELFEQYNREIFWNAWI